MCFLSDEGFFFWLKFNSLNIIEFNLFDFFDDAWDDFKCELLVLECLIVDFMVDFLVGFLICLMCVFLFFEFDFLLCELCSTVFVLGSFRIYDFFVLCFFVWSALIIKFVSEMLLFGLLVFFRFGVFLYCFLMFFCLIKLIILFMKLLTKFVFFGVIIVVVGSVAGVCKRVGVIGIGEGIVVCDVFIVVLVWWLISDMWCCLKWGLYVIFGCVIWSYFCV